MQFVCSIVHHKNYNFMIKVFMYVCTQCAAINSFQHSNAALLVFYTEHCCLVRPFVYNNYWCMAYEY